MVKAGTRVWSNTQYQTVLKNHRPEPSRNGNVSVCGDVNECLCISEERCLSESKGSFVAVR